MAVRPEPVAPAAPLLAVAGPLLVAVGPRLGAVGRGWAAAGRGWTTAGCGAVAGIAMGGRAAGIATGMWPAAPTGATMAKRIVCNIAALLPTLALINTSIISIVLNSFDRHGTRCNAAERASDHLLNDGTGERGADCDLLLRREVFILW